VSIGKELTIFFKKREATEFSIEQSKKRVSSWRWRQYYTSKRP